MGLLVGAAAATAVLTATAATHGGRRAVAQIVPAASPARSSRPAAAAPQMTASVAWSPVPADADVPASYRPAIAGPFDLAGASRADRGRALQCLTAAIYYEAGSEPPDGQRAVAQVVLNRVRHPAFPATVCGVVYQGAERAACQFSFACDGAATRNRPVAAVWARAALVASRALAGGVYPPVGLATHYHTFAVAPGWNRSLVMTAAVGSHVFHRWKGAWGRPAAFGRPYRGGEPEYVDPLMQSTAGPVLAAGSVDVRTSGTTLLETTRRTTPIGRLPEPDGAVAADTDILPRWRHSGEPLR